MESLGYLLRQEDQQIQWEEGDTGYWASISSCSLKKEKGAVSDLRANDNFGMNYLDEIGHDGGVWRWWAGNRFS